MSATLQINLGLTWGTACCSLLQKPGSNAAYLETQEVLELTQRFREYAFPNEPVPQPRMSAMGPYPCCDWPLTVGSLDWVGLQISETLMGYVRNSSRGRPQKSYYVTNTQDCRGNGSHWIAVAIAMHWS